MWITVVVAIVVSASAAVSSWRVAADSHRQLAALRRSVAAAAATSSDVRRSLNAQVPAFEFLSGRVAGVEAAIHRLPDPAAVAARVRASVVVVRTPEGLGSAFVIRRDGNSTELITNAHVVADVWNTGGRGVELTQGDKTFSAAIRQFNDTYDLALLETPQPLDPLATAAQRGHAGDPVLVVGAPLGLEGSVSNGVISSYRSEDGIEYLQVSAAINPGNSGGPVVDSGGHVLGVSVGKLVGIDVEGLGFAVPVERVCDAFHICGTG